MTVFRNAALAAILAASGWPAKAQIHSGSREPLPTNLTQRAATARADFGAALASALSPDSVEAALRIIKAQPDVAGTGVTNFDDVSAPCAFEETTPLRGVEQFAFFWAPAPDGGAIVDQCGNWGIDAHSPPNFLAFNTTASYYPGIPKTPELIFVGKTSKSSVSFWISCGDNPQFPVGVVAYGNSGVLGVVTATPNDTWQQVTISAEGIIAIGLVGDPVYLMVDDIQAQ